MTDVGVRLPGHLTASGRAILAALPPAQVRALYPDRAAFVDRHGRGPAALSALRALLTETRQRGYAAEDGEVTAGLRQRRRAGARPQRAPVAGVAMTFPERRRAVLVPAPRVRETPPRSPEHRRPRRAALPASPRSRRLPASRIHLTPRPVPRAADAGPRLRAEPLVPAARRQEPAGPMQVVAVVVVAGLTAVGVAAVRPDHRQIVRTSGSGSRRAAPTTRRTRGRGLLKETLRHTRMLQWTVVGAAHWFVFVGFGLLFFTLVTAYGQLFDAALRPAADRPLLRSSSGLTELFALGMLVAIVAASSSTARPGPRSGCAATARPLLRLDDVAGLLRRGGHPRRRPVHRGAARARVRPGYASGDEHLRATRLHFPLTSARRAVRRPRPAARSRT